MTVRLPLLRCESMLDGWRFVAGVTHCVPVHRAQGIERMSRDAAPSTIDIPFELERTHCGLEAKPARQLKLNTQRSRRRSRFHHPTALEPS